MMKKIKIPLVLSVLFLITACTSMPISTMIKMARLSPLEMDPQQLVVAVKMGKGLNVRDGDVVIDFKFSTDDPETSFDHQFPVLINNEYVVPASLKEDLKGNERFTIMQLSEEDALTMYNAQQIVTNYRRNNENDSGAGSLAINVVSACRNENFSWNDSKLNIYLKTYDEEDFFLFLRNFDITKLSDDVQSDLDALPSCTA